jgi:hypothetical protein
MIRELAGERLDCCIFFLPLLTADIRAVEELR